MKILFVYFSKKQMCETAEQAIEFINGLKYRNQENQRNISVNEHTKKILHSAFATEWQTNNYGQPFLMLNGMYRSGNIEIATTGCGNTRIYGYKPLGDTVEEHDKAVAAKANAMRVKQEDFFNKKLEERKIELNAIRKGWYHVELEIRINVLNKIGNDYVADKTFSGDIIAESGMDAYNKAVEYVKKSPSELCAITTTGILQDYSNPYDNGFSFIFLGVRTDDGYSVEKWEELMEK
ncbi:hypothetical protein [Prevotella disiens]|nr:hypothetical protein [Prevotella disiens]